MRKRAMPIKRILDASIIALLLAVAAGSALAGQNISAEIEDGWIIASQGSDEDYQIVRVKVWGPTAVKGRFYQLDADPENEYVVVSRGTGSGPYYKLQIVDFLPDGILTWSYDSSGVPKVENGLVLLGRLPEGYQGGATKPVYDTLRFSVRGGLSKLEEE